MAPKKRVLAVVKIQLEAGSATPAPPVGTALGPHGVQTMEFCKQYNAATESQRGSVIPVEITIYEDRSFTFVLKTSPTPVLLRQASGVEKGASLVAMSIRTPPPIVPRDPFGSPVQRTSMLLSLLPPRLADHIGRMTSRLLLGDLSRYGLPNADWRPYSSGRVPVIDVGFVNVLKRGLLQIRPELVRLTPTEAVYADGRSEPFDAVIAATGFTTGLASLLETGQALNHLNEPTGSAGEPTSCPGLFFIGFTHSLRGHLFEANRASRKLAANVDRYLQHASPISR